MFKTQMGAERSITSTPFIIGRIVKPMAINGYLPQGPNALTNRNLSDGHDWDYARNSLGLQ